MLELRAIAELEEARLTLGFAEVAPESCPLPSGGVMARGEPGTWVNSAVGLGLKGPVSSRELDDVVRWFTERSIEPRVEVCPFADQSLIDGLGARAFIPRLFENVFFRPVAARERVDPPRISPDGLIVRAVNTANEAEVREYARATVTGFFDDGSPLEADFALAERVARHPRVTPYAAWLDGRIVGGGGIERAGDVAALFGLSVDRNYRRRGIQQALVAARLNFLSASGCPIATISSRPGVATERNARRMGFQVAYTKVIMVRPGAGLRPNAW